MSVRRKASAGGAERRAARGRAASRALPAAARKPGTVELARALSKLGLASRREAEEWILAGRVRVDGRIERDPRRRVVPERAKLSCDERPLAPAERVVILFHKPRGTLVTRRDPKGRPTVHERLEGLSVRVEAVGRLDQATSGLLLLTNDTRLADWLCDPRSAVPRLYSVTVRGWVSEETLARLAEGVRERGELLRPSDVKLRKRSRRESHLLVELCEGKNREIRRLFAACGHEVVRLARIAFGGLELGRLAPGAHRVVDPAELERAFPAAPPARAS